MSGHALLSPSGASRWMTCTPSARLEEQFPEETSVFAEEGTLAHKLSELLIGFKLGRVTKAAYKKQLSELKTTLNSQGMLLYDESMQNYCDEYATYVVEQYNAALSEDPSAMIFLETRLDMTDYVPEGFGTGDVNILGSSRLQFIDLKYGKGVPVHAENNKQLKLYALGALKEYDLLFDLEMVSMTIYQPRIGNISSWELSVADLLAWAETELKPAAVKAFAGEGEYVPGKHCQFCKAKPVCKALRDHNLELAKYEFRDSNVLTPEEIVDVLDRSDLFKKWIGAVEAYALSEAVNHGVNWPGYKIVEGRSQRKYSDPAIVQSTLIEAGYSEEDISTRQLLGLTAMEKFLGKDKFSALLNGLLIKPPGSLTLVPESDKRTAYNSVAKAQQDFSESI